MLPVILERSIRAILPKNMKERIKHQKTPMMMLLQQKRNLEMIGFLDGATYQQKLFIPMVCRVATLIRKDKHLNFTITNDDEEVGLFDDIVFKSDVGDLFIQAKHKEDKSYTITWDNLASTDKSAPFTINWFYFCCSYTKDVYLYAVSCYHLSGMRLSIF
ncbi:uncharacterized protein LOC131261062 isoform X3 [Anopheles coustani]|uniref:uncharacterized protein LOC131261062 isoform X3 n=1 Tax=Anopheles coustani TaxID=139045 RepID=UPI00265B6EFB|nr:uncharacterized protein LOC131261062 isoform X3 [Anopheles coustani]